ncbi:hypothetical protein MTO96_050587 [Rhipicephalus appendiculatus]
MGSVEKIIQDNLDMRKESAHWVPRLLTPFEKQERVEFSQALLTMYHANQEDFFNRLITQDECWVHHYDSETIRSPDDAMEALGLTASKEGGESNRLQRRYAPSPQRARSCAQSFGTRTE